jgi:Ca2+-binding EF-hand superfamily protein
MTYLTSNTMSQNRRRDLAEVFMEIDENHNGSLEFTELV